jgi:hypothetical protein
MSARATFYIQQCPTCGRRLRICVEYLGKSIQCRHCRAVFTACASEESSSSYQQQSALLRRVDQLLALTENTSDKART